MNANQTNMTTGSPIRHIITFAIPLFLGMLFQQFYNIADTMIVSRTIGESALAAVGSTGPISFLIIFAFGRTMALLFIEESSTELIERIYRYMVTCAAFYWAMAFIHVVRFAIQGLGYGTIVMIAGMIEMVARAAVGILFVPIFGYSAACFASPAAWVLADLFIIPAFIIVMRRAKKRIATTQMVGA